MSLSYPFWEVLLIYHNKKKDTYHRYTVEFKDCEEALKRCIRCTRTYHTVDVTRRDAVSNIGTNVTGYSEEEINEAFARLLRA